MVTPILAPKPITSSPILIIVLILLLVVFLLIVLFKTKGWTKLWLKGGLIGLISFPLIGLISTFFTGTFFYWFFEMIAFFSQVLGPFGLLISFPLIGFILGSLIGLIIQKMK